MAADLYIHVFSEGQLSEQDFKRFFGSTIGSKWFDEDSLGQAEDDTEIFDKIRTAPYI